MDGCFFRNSDVVLRMPSLHISRLLLLLLFFGNVWKAFTKSIPEQGTLEVLIRVQVFDNSNLSPLSSPVVEVYGNHSALASGVAGSNGVVKVTFQYQPGTWIIITASKHGFVTNTAPWHANRIPLYASVSLYLLPQRPATLILYDDFVQVLLGSPGVRNQPWVQFQRKAVRLPPNSTYTELSAVLTAAKSKYEIGAFPYHIGLESNGTGVNSSWLELTPVTAVSTHLFTRNGTRIQVSGPIHISIPLPGDTPVRAATSIPAWRFDAKTGVWIRNGTGYVKKEGVHLTWNFIAPQLGYWVAAISSGTEVIHLHGRKKMYIQSVPFLKHHRRRCLKPRQQQHRKVHISSTLDSSKKDQGTSTPHLNLISSSHIESASSNGDMDAHAPILKSAFSSSQEFESSRENFFKQNLSHKMRHSKVNIDNITRQGGAMESFQMKVARSIDASNTVDPSLLDDYRRSYNCMMSQQTMEDKSIETNRRHIISDKKGYTQDLPSPPSLPPPHDFMTSQSVDHLGRPTSLSQPGQLIFCRSIDQMKDNMYRKVMPTLVIPAHYVRLTSEYQEMEQAMGMTLEQQQQQEIEGIQMQVQMQVQQQANQQTEDPEGRGWAPHPSTGPVRIPVLFNDSTVAQMSGELQALTEKKLLELGVKPHPRAWFVSLDGRSNSHIRHSYIDLQGNERRRSNDASLDSGVDVNESKIPRRIKEEREKHGLGTMAYSKLGYVDDMEQSSSESRTAVCSPEDNSLTPLLDESLENQGATIPRRRQSRGNISRSSVGEIQRDCMTSPEDEMNDPSEGGDDQGDKKSPWQKREERPLMVFNVN
ncbi:protein FAM171A2-like isoform X2 [Polyodon spathula]|uniref:protein FAM171A2-like isoform X2 n=1 Tax=Polyodon spathula TaxID=7913 RepID=UPI001B7F4FAF|nr:protein FAM171A2-like isoform X2 [Polyodon spathula]